MHHELSDGYIFCAFLSNGYSQQPAERLYSTAISDQEIFRLPHHKYTPPSPGFRMPQKLTPASSACGSLLFLPLRSVTTCNSPLNGSLVVYSLGERADTAPEVRLGSYGHLLSVAIHAMELLDWPLLRRLFDPR